MGYGIKKRFRKRNYRFGRKRKLYTKRVRKIAKGVVINMSETKYKIDNLNQLVSATSGYEKIYGNNITVGTGNDQRIGNQIRIARVGFDLNFVYIQGNSTTPAAFVRIILAYPRKGISTSDLATRFTNTDPGVFGRLDPDQAITIYDKRLLISAVSGTNGMTTARLRYYKYMRMMACNYEDATAGLDHVPILYIVSDAGGTTTASMQCAGTLSVSYKDS